VRRDRHRNHKWSPSSMVAFFLKNKIENGICKILKTNGNKKKLGVDSVELYDCEKSRLKIRCILGYTKMEKLYYVIKFG
jgi:hypothetical protein